jgi:hypothetical protein
MSSFVTRCGARDEQILDTGLWMLDKTSNRSFLFIKYPASGIQHHFVSSYGAMILIPATAGSV